MSTPNFYNQKDFKLFVQSFEPVSIEEYEKEYFMESFLYDEWKEADEEDKDDILERAYNEDMESWNEIFYEDLYDGADGFKDVMEDFNDTLAFLKVEFKSGYYDGVQLYVSLESENPYELDNDDCRYYFDDCRSKCIRKFESEINKVNKWMEKVATQYGWRELICLGIFSNGEAVYRYAKDIRDAVMGVSSV